MRIKAFGVLNPAMCVTICGLCVCGRHRDTVSQAPVCVCVCVGDTGLCVSVGDTETRCLKRRTLCVCGWVGDAGLCVCVGDTETRCLKSRSLCVGGRHRAVCVRGTETRARAKGSTANKLWKRLLQTKA